MEYLLHEQLLPDYFATYYKKSGKSQTTEFYEEMIEKNYDNSGEILKIIDQHRELVHKHVILFNLPETLKS